MPTLYLQCPSASTRLGLILSNNETTKQTEITVADPGQQVVRDHQQRNTKLGDDRRAWPGPSRSRGCRGGSRASPWLLHSESTARPRHSASILLRPLSRVLLHTSPSKPTDPTFPLLDLVHHEPQATLPPHSCPCRAWCRGGQRVEQAASQASARCASASSPRRAPDCHFVVKFPFVLILCLLIQEARC